MVLVDNPVELHCFYVDKSFQPDEIDIVGGDWETIIMGDCPFEKCKIGMHTKEI